MNNTKESIVLKYDNMGIPSIMLKVENTAPTPEEADRMFFVRGVEYDSIYLSKYINCIRNGRAYSLPAVDPAAIVSMDDAIKACRAKGEGWHVLTWAEWRYIVRNTIPGIHGNTERGKYHMIETECGIKASNGGRTLTGSGPDSWFHNGVKETGIADVVGLVWKIITGIRLKNGIFQYMKDNDAAHPDADLSEDSSEFLEVLVDDRPVKIGKTENGLSITTGDVSGWNAVRKKDVCVDLEEIPQILKDLGIITKGMEKSEEWFAADAELDEAVCFVSGGYRHTSSAGPGALGLSSERSGVSTSIGFFSACLGEPVTR
jgi:hypothetical protein